MRWLIDGFSAMGRDDGPQLERDDLLLRPARMADFSEWQDLRAASREFLAPWEPLWPQDDLTRPAFRKRVAQAKRDIAEQSAYALLIIAEGQMVGGITLANIRRRAAQTGTLGYWMGAEFAGKGYMTRSVRLVSDFAFLQLQLDRLEAACLPENAASIRVLEKAGFKREGFARAYLSIAGRRRDHLLFGLLNADFFPPNPGRV
ncbi:RimL Acetyltransferases, including N-acetylases of ribosomal proteins [Rhabdaerophilaceae bacterium]